MNNNYQKIIDFFCKRFDRPNFIVETWLIGALDEEDIHPMWLESKKMKEIFEDKLLQIDWQAEFEKLERKYLIKCVGA